MEFISCDGKRIVTKSTPLLTTPQAEDIKRRQAKPARRRISPGQPRACDLGATGS